ncbi:PrsW family glutamic-type intramembrane protease [Isosphaeraceae bacterium EP7]
MAITFECGCGKVLKARDELAGRKARCPQCGTTLPIPQPEAVAFDPEPDLTYSLHEDEPSHRPATPSTYQPSPQAETRTSRSRTPSPQPAATKARARAGGESSLLEYSYLLLAFALIPLVISLLSKEDKSDIQDRFTQTVQKATPEEQKRIEGALSNVELSLDDAIAVLPGHKLDGAHLSRDTSAHWVYAAIATVGFLLLIGLFFSVERAQTLHLLGIGAFTGTVGVIVLLLVQFCSNFRLRRFGGRGVFMIIMLILTFIGWSYDSANDPDSNFLLSALGFTFGVGLCEEFAKAIPLFFYFKRHAEMGWRGACLWGLASGVGFGISEGIMYSSRYYNGISGFDIYLVRFVSCVALHAMWSASVGIAISRNVDHYEHIDDAGEFGLFMLRVMAVPMLLHGFYDTLLKQDMNAGALVVALLSFGWLAWHIELARVTYPGAGRAKAAKKMAY